MYIYMNLYNYIYPQGDNCILIYIIIVCINIHMYMHMIIYTYIHNRENMWVTLEDSYRMMDVYVYIYESVYIHP
jgi:hypothetical protein